MAGILLEGDHVTDEERAAHACALAAKEREKSSGITPWESPERAPGPPGRRSPRRSATQECYKQPWN